MVAKLKENKGFLKNELEVQVKDLKQWMSEDTGVVLIDVREPDEHEICHIKGAVLIPLDKLLDGSSEKISALDKEASTVVHCHHGGRSAKAVKFLRAQGFSQVRNLHGGIDAWALEVDPAMTRY